MQRGDINRLGLGESCWAKSLWGEHCPELLRGGSGQRRGSYLCPAALLTVLAGTSAACQGKQAKSRKLEASTPGPIEQREQTPQWLGRGLGGACRGGKTEHKVSVLVQVSVFALRAEQMCMRRKHTPIPCRLGWEPLKGPGSPIPCPPPSIKHKDSAPSGPEPGKALPIPKASSSPLHCTSGLG